MTSSSAFDPVDRAWMEQALALGALAEGATSPNPRVGCLLVRDGKLVGSGFHRAHGAPHAEAEAVSSAGEGTRGATAYVTLEPCAHHGLTPPCADLLAAKGVRRVVASLRDPNPLVNGSGFERLRAAGVQVDVGLLAEASYRLNEPFLHRYHCGRPLVTIKAAVSLDGMTSARSGCSRWISGEPSRRFAHRLRLRHDAVLVGAGTVRVDDPRLTVRLPGVDAVRVRAVLCPGLDIDPEAAIFRREGTNGPLPRIYAHETTSSERDPLFEGRAVIVRVAARGSGLALDEVLLDLARQQVQSVLVEGGGHTIGRFLEAGLADRAALFVAKRLLGAGGASPLVDLPSVSEPARGWRLEQVQQVALGEDQLLLGLLCGPEGGD
jgi:diaminohydroxyphosphoribosylaminopyrimidine deaminase/5-amino-6-(5-phosphoribosylamino)uracil reductase